MLYNHFTEKLLGLQGVIIKNIEKNRLSAYIINKLTNECSFSSVAREVYLSVTTVIRIFDLVSYPKITKLPTVLSIDEFKGNTWGEKYQCILTDPLTGKVLDILPKRYGHYLTEYFRQFSKFVSDMWKTYSNISSVWFKNATQIVDKYHWIRQVIWAFERVRKAEQKKFSKEYRILHMFSHQQGNKYPPA